MQRSKNVAGDDYSRACFHNRVNSTRQKIDTIFFDLERDEETRKRRACTILPNGLTTEGTLRRRRNLQRKARRGCGGSEKPEQQK